MRVKKKNVRKIRVVALAVVVMGVAVFTTGTTVNADTATVTTPVTISVPETCSMSSTTDTAHTATIPGGTSQSDIGKTTIKAVCNDMSGFSIKAVGYSNNTEGDTKLYNNADSSIYINTGTATSGNTSAWAMKINAVSGTYTPSIVYASNYADVPSTNTAVAHFLSNTDSTEGSSIETTYQAYIGPTQAAGTYAGSVKYTLFHPDDAATLADITYMQDISVAICNNTTIGTSATLIDRRDSKTYNVAKLADGNCWMTQNLDLDLDSTETYTSSDTDISADWTPSLSTYTTGTTTWNSSTTTPESYDPGDVCYDEDTQETCTSANKSHHVGNYYNWTAAIATNDSSSYYSDGVAITQSICPRGWTLPLSEDSTGSGSFYYLLNQYGLTDDAISGSYSIWGNPLNFVLGGSWSGRLYNNSIGEYWSSMPETSGVAYHLYFDYDTEYVTQSAVHGRGYGESVRCVATAE